MHTFSLETELALLRLIDCFEDMKSCSYDEMHLLIYFLPFLEQFDSLKVMIVFIHDMCIYGQTYIYIYIYKYIAIDWMTPTELQIHLVNDNIRKTTKSIIEASFRPSHQYHGRIIPIVFTSSGLQAGAVESIEDVLWFLATYQQVNCRSKTW